MHTVLLADLRSTSEKVESLLRRICVSVEAWQGAGVGVGGGEREETPAIGGVLPASVNDVGSTSALGGRISSDCTLFSKGVESLMLSFPFSHSSGVIIPCCSGRNHEQRR